MNISEKTMKKYPYQVHIGSNENYLGRIFGQSETLCCYETLQFEDYDTVVFSYFDPEERRQRHINVFPEDSRKAAELGARLSGAAA